MKPESELMVSKIVDQVISSLVRQFSCPECGHLTLAFGTYSWSNEQMYCYTCGHTFRKQDPLWVDVDKGKL